jgi:hypothetical protein
MRDLSAFALPDAGAHTIQPVLGPGSTGWAMDLHHALALVLVAIALLRAGDRGSIHA